MNNSKLEAYLKKFEQVSLAKSIYTITSWIGNRNYIGMTDDLNRCFISIEDECGSIIISTYEDFKFFFNGLVPIIESSFSYPEDFISDTGEVRFYYQDKFRKIIIGNGSEDIYEGCFLIESIVQDDEYLKSVWYEILSYEDFILTALYKDNEAIQYGKFTCPPKNYFENISEIYISLMNTKLRIFFQNFESLNEEIYDFFTKNNGYPVFLPVLKESFLEKVEQILPTEVIKRAAWSATINQVRDNYMIASSNNMQTLFSLTFIEEETNREVLIENSFAIWNKEDVVIFIPSDLNDEVLHVVSDEIHCGINTLIGFTMGGELIQVDFNSKKSVVVQKIVDVELSPNITKVTLLSDTDDVYIDIKGLMGIINFASNIDEIIEYVKSLNKRNKVEKIINFSGITSHFQIWKDMNKVIVEGASKAVTIVPPYQSVEKTIEFFNSDMKYYPYNTNIAFSKIHHWNLIPKTKADLSLNSKGGTGSADIFFSNNKSLIYQELHFIIEDIDDKTIETITSFHEIMINEFTEHKELILSHCEYDYLEINLVSERVLQMNVRELQIIDSEYCRKIIFKSENNGLTLLVKPKWERILQDNFSEKNKSFENDLLLSFLEGVNFINVKYLIAEVKKSDNAKRTSSIGQVEIPYYVEPHLTFKPPKLSAFKNVRKIMAAVVENVKLKPKEYDESEILGVIKRFRNEIRNDLIIKISAFDTITLHKKLLNLYSAVLFQINIHQERINQFQSTDHLQEKALNEFKEEAIRLREESKTYKQIIEYLMEENLICDRTDRTHIFTDQNIEELIAYSKWIMDFQTMSDSLSYGASGWDKLSIREDYVVEIEETDKYLDDANLLKKLRYEYGDYSYRDNEFDKNMLDSVDKVFQSETQISFRSLFSTLTLLYSNAYISEFIQQDDIHIVHNVIEAPINSVANLFVQEVELPVEEFFKVLAFITLDIDHIPDSSGIIPIWEKKKRKNKISAQPIVIVDDHLIFSPVALYELKKSWFQGMMSFILPYNTGLEKTTKAIDEWKKYYENKIVIDLASLFKGPNYDVYMDKELYKLDPKGNHPHNLGDYDLIVIAKEKKEVLLFEVKYMRLSQTMKDSLGDQGKYFLNRKAKAKQFEKRILYFQKHKSKIMNNLGFEGDFLVKKYFLSNKNIRSFFKDYPFEVIGFNEFKTKYFD